MTESTTRLYETLHDKCNSIRYGTGRFSPSSWNFTEKGYVVKDRGLRLGRRQDFLKGGGGVTLSETEGTHQNDMSTSKPRFTQCDDKKKP